MKRNNGISKTNLEVNNQPVLTAPIISNNNPNNNLPLTKHGLDKLSLTMSAAKLQKSLFESAKHLKLKDFKYDANPSVRRRLFKSFYGQLVSILSGEEHFQGVLSDNFEITPFDDPYGTPNKVLFMLVLTYVDEHYKTVIRRKDTNGFGDKAILALQAQCASITAFETHSTHREFTGLRIVPKESISAYLRRFSIARDKAEDAGNDYDNDTLVDLFLSSLGNSGHEYYSSFLSTLEFQRAETKSIPFSSLEQRFLQLEERHALRGSARREGANAALLNPNPLAASNRQGGKHKGKPQQRGGVNKKLRPASSTGSTSTGRDGKPILCFKCGKPGHKKADCPTNVGASNGSARGSSVALDTQETHHACMAVARNVTAAEHAFCTQVVEKSVIVEPRRIVAAVWLPAFMTLRPMNGFGRSSTPTMTFHIPGITFCHGTLDPDSPCRFGAGRRDFTGKLSCIDKDGVLDMGPRWGIFMYPHRHSAANLITAIVDHILYDGVLPLGKHFFQREFEASDASHAAYCQRISEFLEGELKGSLLYLEDRCITIHVQDTFFEVNILPRFCIPRAPLEMEELYGGLASCPHFMVLDEIVSVEFREAMRSVRLAYSSNSNGIHSPVHSEGSDFLIPEESPVFCACPAPSWLSGASTPRVSGHGATGIDTSSSPTVAAGSTMGNFISSGYFSAYVVPRTPYSVSSLVCPSANSLGFSPARIGSQGLCKPFMTNTYGHSPRTLRSTTVQPRAYAYYAQGISSSLVKQSKKLDPPLTTIGIGSDLRNWMPDTGASSHFTPCLSDMKEVEEGLDLGVEVADGHIVQCTARGIVEINMIADDGLTLKAFYMELSMFLV